MVTKSRNRSGLVWSLIALVFAVASLSICASFAFDLAASGWTRLSETVGYFSRIITGGHII